MVMAVVASCTQPLQRQPIETLALRGYSQLLVHDCSSSLGSNQQSAGVEEDKCGLLYLMIGKY